MQQLNLDDLKSICIRVRLYNGRETNVSLATATDAQFTTWANDQATTNGLPVSFRANAEWDPPMRLMIATYFTLQQQLKEAINAEPI